MVPDWTNSNYEFDFYRVQDPQNSELVSYIRKLLTSGIGKENANVVRNNDNDEGSDDLGAKNGNVRSGIPTIGSSGIPRYSYNLFTMLIIICSLQDNLKRGETSLPGELKSGLICHRFKQHCSETLIKLNSLLQVLQRWRRVPQGHL